MFGSSKARTLVTLSGVTACVGDDGWLVGLRLAPDPIYLVEMASGGDIELPQSSLKLMSPPTNT